ncbi:MAG: ribonuclease III [Candidatus Nealsonbacteria bacterium]|nr:MAG: ribonuclease III [Candidatus Nealsonbacteria bacterium]
MEINLARRKKLRRLEKELGIKFTHLELLNQALIHTSYAKSNQKEILPHNEKLEFLGDAVLNLVTAEYLFHQYPCLNEGELSQLRSKIVSQESLSQYAHKIKLEEYILLGKNQEEIRSQPALLANAYEAIIGAVYLDKGLADTRGFIFNLFTSIMKRIEQIKDFKSWLQEYVQSFYKTLPQYKVIKEIGPEHKKRFKVEVRVKEKILGEGWGTSKKKAEMMAARSIWKNFTKIVQ